MALMTWVACNKLTLKHIICRLFLERSMKSVFFQQVGILGKLTSNIQHLISVLGSHFYLDSTWHTDASLWQIFHHSAFMLHFIVDIWKRTILNTQTWLWKSESMVQRLERDCPLSAKLKWGLVDRDGISCVIDVLMLFLGLWQQTLAHFHSPISVISWIMQFASSLGCRLWLKW